MPYKLFGRVLLCKNRFCQSHLPSAVFAASRPWLNPSPEVTLPALVELPGLGGCRRPRLDLQELLQRGGHDLPLHPDCSSPDSGVSLEVVKGV
jgi:hypothetical protein